MTCSRRALQAFLVFAASALTAVIDAPPARAETTVDTADGRRLAGVLAALDRDRLVLRTSAGEIRLALAEVRSVDLGRGRPEDPMGRHGQAALAAEDGSVLAIRSVALAGTRFEVVTDLAGKVSAPLEGITRLLRPTSQESPADLMRLRQQLRIERGSQDVLIAGTGDQRVPLAGALLGLDDRSVRFQYEGAETALDAATVAIVELAKPAKPLAGSPFGLLVGADGSRIVFAALSLGGKSFRVTSLSFGSMTVDAARVASLQFQSARVTYLSDLTPTSTRRTPFFDEDFPTRQDRSASGAPLRLGGAAYEKGLGLHARCELRFDLGGRFARLAALAGIDDDARVGAARLELLADGRPAGEPILLDRARPPRPFQVELKGARELTIRVEFVDRTFGAGARVNLVDPILFE
jgi:hypothetical protein